MSSCATASAFLTSPNRFFKMKIRHIHDPQNPRGPAITIVSELIYESEDCKYPDGVRFAIAVCSPKDAFCKKTGVRIATDRLYRITSEHMRYIHFGCRRTPYAEDIESLIDRQIVMMDLPDWAIDTMRDYIHYYWV